MAQKSRYGGEHDDEGRGARGDLRLQARARSGLAARCCHRPRPAGRPAAGHHAERGAHARLGDGAPVPGTGTRPVEQHHRAREHEEAHEQAELVR